MKPRAAWVRTTILSAVALLVAGAAHSEIQGGGLVDGRQERVASIQMHGPVILGLNADARSMHGSPGTVTASLADRAAAVDAEASPLEKNAAIEPDVWTMLAGSLGLMLFVAVRRL